MKKFLRAFFVLTVFAFSANQMHAQITDAIYNWAKSAGATVSNENGNSIAVDGSGNVYITGSFQGTVDFDPGVGVANLTSVALTDIFFAKYNSSGIYQWAKDIGSTSSDVGNAIAVDATGNVFITGYFSNTADFDPGVGTQNLTSASIQDVFFAKYTTAGVYVWAKRMGGTGTDVGNAIVLDNSTGDVFVAGYFSGTADFDPGVGTQNLLSSGLYDIFFARYNSLGNYVWAKGMGSTANDMANGIAVGDWGNVYVTGYFQNTADFDPGVGTINLVSAGSYDIFVAKYNNASGIYQWAKTMGSSGQDQGNAIYFSLTANKCYITGQYNNTVDFDPGVGVVTYTSAGGSDIFFEEFDVVGTYMMAKSMGTFTNEVGQSIYATSSGTIYISGFYGSTVDFDPGVGVQNVSNAGLQDGFFARYDASGNYMWAKGVGGNGNDQAMDIAVDAAQNVYITGFFNNTGDFDPSSSTANLTSLGGNDIYFAKYTYCTIGGNIVSSASCTSGCSGGANMNITTGNPPYTYLWSNASTTSSVTGLCPGTYSITITEANGCSTTDSVTITQPPLPNPVQICMVTVDTVSAYNQIVWDKPVATDISDFIIYREISSIFVPIDTVPYSAYSVYKDSIYVPLADPNTSAFRYEIAVVDTCGTVTAQSNPHTTVLLQASQGVGNTVNLAWNFYGGNTVNQYIIYRDTTGTGNLDSIGVQTGTLNNYTDNNPSQNVTTLRYVLGMDWTVTCNPAIKNLPNTQAAINTSHSNIKNMLFTPDGVTDLEAMYALSIFPNPNNGMFTISLKDLNKSNCSVTVYDELGQQVYAENLTGTKTIDLTNLAKGIYSVKVEIDGKQVVKKLAIN